MEFIKWLVTSSADPQKYSAMVQRCPEHVGRMGCAGHHRDVRFSSSVCGLTPQWIPGRTSSISACRSSAPVPSSTASAASFGSIASAPIKCRLPTYRLPSFVTGQSVRHSAGPAGAHGTAVAEAYCQSNAPLFLERAEKGHGRMYPVAFLMSFAHRPFRRR